ncbi:MAG: RIP metalloprotease RseP [Eubacteriales bacterium]|jgi:regulator of sigma E protease|nr:RIP metalloprotease RseP [Eubacteriales bacterium]
MHIVIGIIAAIVIFAILVIVHEGGHFFAAKAVGVQVNEFSVGMGPLIYKKAKNGTDYSVRALPIGGYVALEGENEDSDNEHAFNNRPAWAKALVIAAGPVMNFVLAVLVLAVLITYVGTSVTPKVAHVEDGSPAYEAGITAGSTITAVDGQDTPDGSDVREAITKAARDGNSVDITFTDADGTSRDSEINFTTDENGNKIIGVQFVARHNVLEGIKYGFIDSFKMEKEMLVVLGQLVTGQGSAGDVVGPVGIVDVVGKTAQTGFLNMVYLLALLSLNLGLVNILPFPALDGGRLLFIVIRAVTGNMISDDMENRINYAGLMILFMLMIVITLKDVYTFIIK